MKTRRCYVVITALVITAIGICWALYGKYNEFMIQNGWMAFLYQLPLINAIIMPLLATVLASRICGIEHKGAMLKQICTSVKRGRLYDAKLIFGLGIILLCVLIMWDVTIMFGIYKGFGGECPIKLYLLYLLFTAAPTVAIYIFQHTLSLVCKNQAIPFFAGIIGEFAGLFSMFLPQLPWLRKSVLWGYYGTLQFVGLFGWTKETRYETAYYDLMQIDWVFFAVLVAAAVAMYLIGRYWFSKKEM